MPRVTLCSSAGRHVPIGPINIDTDNRYSEMAKQNGVPGFVKRDLFRNALHDFDAYTLRANAASLEIVALLKL